MFFRRHKPKAYSFSDSMQELRSAGFEVGNGPAGRTRVSRGGCGADVSDASERVRIDHLGVLVGQEIGALVDVGFQKLFQTPSGKRVPALATHLKGLHGFEEDLRGSLGLTSFYNQGLGTTNDQHLYDRVESRDAGVPARAWDKKRAV